MKHPPAQSSFSPWPPADDRPPAPSFAARSPIPGGPSLLLLDGAVVESTHFLPLALLLELIPRLRSEASHVLVRELSPVALTKELIV